MKYELSELRKHISSQGILVKDLMTGVCSKMGEWNRVDRQIDDVAEVLDPLTSEVDDTKMIVLENIDIYLAEHQVEEAVDAIVTEERNFPELKASAESNSYRAAFLQRKAAVEAQLVEIASQPLINKMELKKALSGLIAIGKGSVAHQLLLKSHRSRLQRSIESLLPSFSLCPRTSPATLAKLVFSTISATTKESGLIFGDNPVYTNRLVQWAEWELEYFVRLVKENAPSSETVYALNVASICIQSSLCYCQMLESQGLKLSKLLLVLSRPYIDEVLELNFRRARKMILELEEGDENLSVAPRFVPPLSALSTSSDSALIVSGLKFMYIIDVCYYSSFFT